MQFSDPFWGHRNQQEGPSFKGIMAILQRAYKTTEQYQAGRHREFVAHTSLFLAAIFPLSN
jgi:hypothetical protein